ncbi:MAG: DegV family protein [Bacteroidales bacterium]|nr:DegV family protein [Bacteroidales bacterium]
MNINTKILDGKGLYYSFVAGAQRVFDNQQHLNKINVFPVADADTGTNFASTMRSIIETVNPNANVRVTAAALANAALIGARGNSGIIFAQFLYGFSVEIKSEGTITVESFANSLKNSVKYAYEAISNPVEGTMITVIREWADQVYLLKDTAEDFNSLLTQSIQKAKISLEETKTKLAVLAKAGVVDAGAKAFVLFLEGILEFFQKGLKFLLGTKKLVKVVEMDAILHEEITFRYCTEALLVGQNMNHEKIKRTLDKLGDSLVVAGSPEKTRIHIHTDEPTQVFYKMHKHGDITYQKVDDMIFQNNVVSAPRTKVAIMTDSTCDLPTEFIDKHHIHVVPLNVHFGKNYFLDGVSISGKQFEKLFYSSKEYPSTSQPSFKDFVNKYSYLSSHYDSVISMHITSAMSGTHSNSQKAAKQVNTENAKKFSVVDTKRISGSLGLMVYRATLMAEEGFSHEEITESIEKWKTNNYCFVTPISTKYMVKSGRLSPTKGFIAKLLKIKPVISVDQDGKAAEIGKAFTERGSNLFVMRKVEELLKTKKVWNYAITHFKNQDTADWYASEMKRLTGKDPLFLKTVSPVIQVNVGPGVVTLNIQFE